ncbi:MAG: CMD domain protein [Candidatus Dormiibacterota bacterium]
MADLVAEVLSLPSDAPIAALRRQRSGVVHGIEASYRALFGDARSSAPPLGERAVVAVRVAAWHAEPLLVGQYGRLLREVAPEAATAVMDAALGGIRVEGWDGSRIAPLGPSSGLPARVVAELRHPDLLATHPVDARPHDLAALGAAGCSVPETVTLSQLIGFVSFQARMLATLRVLDGVRPAAGGAVSTGPPLRVATATQPFTQDELGWSPWLPPLSVPAATAEQREALPPPRDRSPYFRLLAHDAPILRARTATELAIFRTPGGLPRSERELSAAVASRVNGCVYCASVHARFASTFSKRHADVQRLLEEGPAGRQDRRWRAIVDGVASLSQTPSRLGPERVAALRGVGLGDLEILDLGQASAFFAWANRLLLTLGEPVLRVRAGTGAGTGA